MPSTLSGETCLYPIIGDPIRFVKSPQQLTAALHERSHNGVCVPMQVPEGELESLVRSLGRVLNVRGLLITMPHKRSMFKSCATASDTSKLLETVSIARRSADGSWHGDMLDGLAFVAALKGQGAKLKAARVLQVGAGGAGGAIAIALLNAGIRELVLYDTNQTRLKKIIQLLKDA